MKILCPAKINLFLNIISKNEDGMHNLKLLNQTIDIYDEIELKKIKEDKIIIESRDNIPKDSSNSVYKAAQIIKEKYQIKDGLKFIIKKIIPIESGLGGESTDAAGTLLLLNKAYNLKIRKKELLSIASSIGSDVGFFIYSGYKEISKTGNVIKEPKINNKYNYYIIIKPDFGLNTKEMFNKLDEYGLKRMRIFNELHNDFMRVVPESIIDIKNYLNSLSIKDHTLSGSGSSYYVALINNDETLYKKIKHHFKKYQIYIAKNTDGFIIKA